MNQLVRRRTDCRACGKQNLVSILDLGKTPPANAFLEKPPVKLRHGASKERWFPLQVNFCRNCSMVQLAHVVDSKLLFENYVYVSSTSPVFIRHFEGLAQKITKQLRLKKDSLVVDIGSNDGILLKPFKKLEMKILGIEPAKNIAKRANQDRVPTVNDFFSRKLAQKLVKKYGRADLITATNVFAHIDNLDDVMEGVKILLKPDGVFLVEVAYLADLLKQNLFDSVYHEHLCYWAVAPMKVLAERLGLKIFGVKHVETHGGSIRVLMKPKASKREVIPSVANFVWAEKKLGLDKLSPYRALDKRIAKNKSALKKLLNKLKHQRKTIIGFGAPAKSTTLLNYFKIDKNILSYIVDDSPYKEGLLTPGTHIPIVKPEMIYQDRPDYVLILAWNFAKPIMKTHRRYKQLGGKFIVPVPEPKII